MACGCGTFVYFGLLHGIDVWGIDPEEWKHRFNSMKADVYGYPSKWKNRFVKGVGEALPFPDGFFDIVSSYQTLEHVQDVECCLRESIRILKPGGMIFLYCPDYRGTFEGHYRLPWLPLFPRSWARFYLKILGRPEGGLSSINYVTEPSIKRVLNYYPLIILDSEIKCSYRSVQNLLSITQSAGRRTWARLWPILRNLSKLFREELKIQLVVQKEN